MSEIDLAIDTHSPEPVYEQIVRQIHGAVRAGMIAPGAPLPTVRQLAGDLMVNRNTVARAYKMLEEQGIVRTSGRRGTFVRQHAATEVGKVQARSAEQAIRGLIDRFMDLGMDQADISRAFASALTAGSGRKRR